jgi:hypothetical protein
MEMFGEEVFHHGIILVLLSSAFVIFGALALKSRKITSFQFQISIFILIWIVGELASLLQDLGLLRTISDELGMQVHLLSMIFFSIMIWIRFLYSRKKLKKIVDSPPPDTYFE